MAPKELSASIISYARRGEDLQFYDSSQVKNTQEVLKRFRSFMRSKYREAESTGLDYISKFDDENPLFLKDAGLRDLNSFYVFLYLNIQKSSFKYQDVRDSFERSMRTFLTGRTFQNRSESFRYLYLRNSRVSNEISDLKKLLSRLETSDGARPKFDSAQELTLDYLNKVNPKTDLNHHTELL